MEVSRFDSSHAAVIATWPVDTVECRAWCSADAVSPADVTSWSADQSVEAWVLVEDGMPVGYGEVWFDDDEQEAELAHVIVAPDRRAAGAGRRLVSALADRGAARFDPIVMRVRPDNLAAQRCYAAAGFVRVSAGEEAEWNVGQPVPYVWMRR